MIDANHSPIQKERVYATVKNAVINAVVKQLFSFENEQQAISRLGKIKQQFVVSKQAKTSPDSSKVILWIEGYHINKADKELGYKGNFAILSIAKIEDRFTITATKIESDVCTHPKRKKEKQNHPDWGHYILRNIKKKCLYFSLDEAKQDLATLHAEYPEISIPAEYHLWLMVYGTVAGEKSPVNKYRFIVRPLPDGTFVIDYKIASVPQPYEKSKKSFKKNTPKVNAQSNIILEKTDGYFASLIQVKRSMKAYKNKATIRKPPETL